MIVLQKPIPHAPMRLTVVRRLDTVQELLSKEDVFFDLVAMLPKLVDLDHLAATLGPYHSSALCLSLISSLGWWRAVQVPKKPSQKTAQNAIVNILTVRCWTRCSACCQAAN